MKRWKWVVALLSIFCVTFLWKRIQHKLNREVRCHSKSYYLKYIPKYYSNAPKYCNQFRYTFLLVNSQICDLRELFLLIAVRSIPHKMAQRNLIRQTWGSLTTVRGSQIRTVFLVGRGANASVQEELLKENKVHQDIIQADFTDSYYNLTIKTMMAFKWALEHCGHLGYFVISDTDMFIDVFKLVKYLQKPNVWTDSSYVLCKAEYAGPARVDRRGKANVSKEIWPSKKYAPWCWGGANVLTVPVIKKLYNTAIHTPRYLLDDVWVGLLATLHGGVCFPTKSEAFISPWHPNDKLMNSEKYFYSPVIFAGIHDEDAVVMSKITKWWQRTYNYHMFSL